jgi:large subunit ribosomal protein L13
MKTYSPKPSEVERKWHVLDAEGKPLGRLASQAAHLLRGKHKPQFAPHLDIGDFVIVVNAAKVRVTGKKETDKIYYHHTGYPGGLRQRTFAEQMRRNPAKVVESAVKGMLPHNRLGRRIYTHLKVYSGPEHPHQAQIAGFGAVTTAETTGAKA